MVVELKERFTAITGMPLPTTLQEAAQLDDRLQERIEATSRARVILYECDARWYEPIRTGWLTSPEQLSRVMKRNPAVYYPLRILAELAQPLNLVAANFVISTARMMGTPAASSASGSPELSIPVLIGGSLLATFGLTMLYRSWGKNGGGLFESLSRPNIIAGSLTGKTIDVADNSKLKSMRDGKLSLRDDPEIASHAALRWHKDAEIRVAKIAETQNSLTIHYQELREAREILETYRHVALALEEFRGHAGDLGFTAISPQEALGVFAATLESAPEPVRQRVAEWLYHFSSTSEESRVLTPAAPDFLKTGALAHAEMVRAWKLFVHALNVQEPRSRPGSIYAVLNALEELQESNEHLQRP